MRIANVTININNPGLSDAARANESLSSLIERFTYREPYTRPVRPITTLTPPPIGELWPGQGGIYAGIARGEEGQPDQHLVLAIDEPISDLNWADAGEWARKVEAEGHTDFRLPTRFESALLYANLQDKVKTGRWYWTGTQYSADHAWSQSFDYGTQSYDDKGYEARARAVRRFTA